MRLAPLLIGCSFLFAPLGQSAEVGFAEDYALAQHRAQILDELVPGSVDYYFYHCLEAQHQGDLERVDQLMKQWRLIKNSSEKGLYHIIEVRLHLLRAGKDPGSAYAELDRFLHLNLHHQSDANRTEQQLPTRLKQDHVSWKAFLAASSHNHFAALNHEGLFRALNEGTFKRFNYLPRQTIDQLPSADNERLFELITNDLRTQKRPHFGSKRIHNQLSLEQLRRLAQSVPAIREQSPYVNAYAMRLAPSRETFTDLSDEQLIHWMERLDTYAQSLSPVHQSLKAYVLYQRLEFDAQHNIFDKKRWLRYLAIPRHVPYINSDWLQQSRRRSQIANLNHNFQHIFPKLSIGSDQTLVREALLHLLADEDDVNEFSKYIDSRWLHKMFAEAKILAGKGNPEEWFRSVNDPQWTKAIGERVDLQFAPHNVKHVTSDAKVRIHLISKNIDELQIKIWELDAENIFRNGAKNIGLDLNLDGLIANHDLRHKLTENTLTRHHATIDLPQISQRGMYMVEFIGGGKRLRTLIRKGELKALQRVSGEGELFAILNEHDQPVPQAQLIINDRAFRANDAGLIQLPFATKPGKKSVIISDGHTAIRHEFHHHGEDYHLEMGLHVERDALIPGEEAQLIIRPRLITHGMEVDLQTLEEVQLEITAINGQGISSSETIENISLNNATEVIHQFRVPNDLRHITVSLSGHIKRLSDGSKQTLSVSDRREINSLKQSHQLVAPHFIRSSEGWIISLRGQGGEPIPNHKVEISFKHRLSNKHISQYLQSDDDGRIHLGKLIGIESIQCTPQGKGGQRNSTYHLKLDIDSAQGTDELHIASGERLAIAWPEGPQALNSERLSLVMLRKNLPYQSRYEALRYHDGMLIADKLEDGIYSLIRHDSQQVTHIRVGGTMSTWGLLRDGMHIREASPAALAVQSAQLNQETLQIKLHGATQHTRIHVIASEFEPSFDAQSGLMSHRIPLYARQAPLSGNRFSNSIKLGDEERYIMERQLHKKYPGVMLERPSLLVNPWKLPEQTITNDQQAAKGDRFASESVAPKNLPQDLERKIKDQRWWSQNGQFDQSRDFLATAPLVLNNLKVDENGTLTLDNPRFITAGQIRIVAINEQQIAQHVIANTAPDVARKDIRVKHLVEGPHLKQDLAVHPLQVGDKLDIKDIRQAQLEFISSIGGLFAHLSTLQKDPRLSSFAFLGNWHTLSSAERQEAYRKHACHEVHLFLYRHDRPFFDQVVAPLLRNKLFPTFIDDYVLENNLESYREPAAWDRLNYIEKALLIQRLGKDGELLRKRLQDQFDLIPRNPQREKQIFETALNGNSLNKTANRRFTQHQNRLQENMRKLSEAPAAPVIMDLAVAVEEVSTEDEAVAARSVRGREEALSRAESGGSGAFMAIGAGGGARGRINGLKQLYRGAGSAKVWAEQYYYQVRQQHARGMLFPLNQMVLDIAGHAGNKPLLSPGSIGADSSLNEVLMALALTDLPFEHHEPDLQAENFGLTATAKAPSLAIHKSIQQSEDNQAGSLMVAQHIFRVGERTRLKDGKQVDAFINDEFLTHVPYSAEIVISNPTSQAQHIQALKLLPEGAVPLANALASDASLLHIPAYNTQVRTISFYFPEPGAFHMPGTQVERDGTVVAWAEEKTLHVFEEPQRDDENSWEWVSQHADDEIVFQWLKQHNLNTINLSRIAWRMQELEFYHKCIDILAQRQVFEHVLWAYSFKHNDIKGIKEYLTQREDFLRRCGPFIKSPLVNSEPIKRIWYEHLEFKPLINARAHRLSERPWIANESLARQYDALIQRLSYQPELNANDRLEVLYYLLLQDRMAEAIDWFQHIKRDEVGAAIPYDYAKAWIALLQGNPEVAQAIVEGYEKLPHPVWQQRFQIMANQLIEITGGNPNHNGHIEVDEHRQAMLEENQIDEASLLLSLDQGRPILAWQGINSVELRYYFMDVELLFSRNPFQSGDNSTPPAAIIAPNLKQHIALTDDTGALSIELPAAAKNRNIIVEAVSDGRRSAVSVFTHNMAVNMTPAFGQLKIQQQNDLSKNLHTVYVKVYRELHNGQVEFHKDGYTDLRGRFDYASVNDVDPSSIKRFAILVLSDEHGAQIKEAAPPAQ